LLRCLGDTSVGPEYEFWLHPREASRDLRLTRDLVKVGHHYWQQHTEAYSKQVRLQTRAPDGPKGMFGTFLHIIRNGHILGLYRGVRAHLHYGLILPLAYSTIALRLPPPPINLLHHPLRRLRGT